MIVKISLTMVVVGSFSISTINAQKGNITLTSTMGVNLHDPLNLASLDLVKADGLTWIRVDALWENVENAPGVYDWSRSDKIVSLTSERELKVLYILCYGNHLYGGIPITQAGIDSYCNFARTAAVRYKGKGLSYEIWNEPTSIEKPNMTTAQYAALCRAAVVAIHEGDPSALCSTGGLARFHLDALNKIYSADVGEVDALGIHCYTMNNPGGKIYQPGCNTKPELIFTNTDQWRNVYKKYLPLMDREWMTEWGPDLSSDCSNDQHQYAYLILRQLLCNWMAGFQMSILYCDFDDVYSLFGKDDNFKGSTLRRANMALKTLASIVGARTIKSFINPMAKNDGAALNDKVWTIQLTGTPIIEIAWVPNGSAKLTVMEGTTCQDQYGDAVSFSKNGKNLDISMNEASGVYFFFLPKGSGINSIKNN